MGATVAAGGLRLALGVYVGVFLLKLSVYLATGSMALLAEAFHSLSDILISAFLMIASLWSGKKADRVHMFGYGRAQNVAALVAATLFISFTSYKLFEEALPRLFHPPAATDYRNLPLALGALGVSMAVAAWPLIVLARGKRGAAAQAQFLELINDELGLLAALVGTLLLIWGLPLADPIAALAVATLIAFNAIGLFRDNLSFLVGRSPGGEFLAGVEAAALSVRGVLGVRELRAEYVGPDTVHAGMRLLVRRGLPVEQASAIAAEVRRRVHERTDGSYCVIQVDAADEQSAAHLASQDSAKRAAS